MKGVFRLGLTGGIGCGKSSTLKIFQTLGWSGIQADLIARRFLEEDAAVIDSIQRRWGVGVFKNNRIDREAVAALVFADEAELRWLEDLLHPRVRDVWRSLIAGAPNDFWIVEIPLLFEKKLEECFDATVCVAVDSTVMENRMTERGFVSENVRARANRQLPLLEKIARADYVISNDGSLEFLTRQILHLNALLRGVVTK